MEKHYFPEKYSIPRGSNGSQIFENIYMISEELEVEWKGDKVRKLANISLGLENFAQMLILVY